MGGVACLVMSFTQNMAFANDKPSLISIGGGYYDAFDNDNDRAFDFRAEYRSGKNIFIDNLHPYAAFEITSDASTWVGGGLLYDWNFAPSWYLTPSFGAGVYAKGSSDLDLDYPVQFRSQLEVAYEFSSAHRVAAALSHVSNASLGDENPGTEVFSVYWHIPMADFF